MLLIPVRGNTTYLPAKDLCKLAQKVAMTSCHGC